MCVHVHLNTDTPVIQGKATKGFFQWKHVNGGKKTKKNRLTGDRLIVFILCLGLPPCNRNQVNRFDPLCLPYTVL